MLVVGREGVHRALPADGRDPEGTTATAAIIRLIVNRSRGIRIVRGSDRLAASVAPQHSGG